MTDRIRLAAQILGRQNGVLERSTGSLLECLANDMDVTDISQSTQVSTQILAELVLVTYKEEQ